MATMKGCEYMYVKGMHRNMLTHIVELIYLTLQYVECA